jgi:hypothetical protein
MSITSGLSYNCQAAVDEKEGVIVAAEVTNEASKKQMLPKTYHYKSQWESLRKKESESVVKQGQMSSRLT